jgi:hypothetical protein
MGARQRGVKLSQSDRPTSKLHRDELVGLALHSVRAQTSSDDPHERETQRMSPTHFQLLLRVQKEGLAIAPADIVRMGEAEAAAMLQLATGSTEIRVRDIAREVADPAPVLPRPPRRPTARRAWIDASELGMALVALVAIAIVVAILLTR